MPDLSLVHPLSDEWRLVLDDIARRRGWPTTEQPARLAPKVARLSQAYNVDGRLERSGAAEVLPARLLFGFPRDVPKAAGAVRELIATGALTLSPTRPLRILDVGAGLGATTFGVVRALAAAGQTGLVEALWIDADAAALDVGAEIARRHRKEGNVALDVRVQAGDVVSATRARGPFDLVLLGQVLSELDASLAEPERVTRHASLLGHLLRDVVFATGSLVVVEPALRDRTRHLHRVRDVLAAGGARVFAPCLHERGCPMLARDEDWCHEDLAVDLPSWLVPTARGAGLRFQGLTFSYLVLRKEGPTLRETLERRAPCARPLRVVSQLRRTKGKVEAHFCGDLEDGGALVSLMRLDREARATEDDLDDLARGDVVRVTPHPSSNGGRVAAETSFERLAPAGRSAPGDVDESTTRPLGDEPR